MLRCSLSTPNDERPGRTLEREAAVFDTNHGAFTQCQYRLMIHLEVFAETGIASFALVGRVRIAIDVVGIDLERNNLDASKLAGWTIGMSLVVLIVGPARLLPALVPM